MSFSTLIHCFVEFYLLFLFILVNEEPFFPTISWILTVTILVAMIYKEKKRLKIFLPPEALATG